MKILHLILAVALLPLSATARPEAFQAGVRALKENNIEAALAAFESSATRASFYAAATVHCLAFESNRLCKEAAEDILSNAKRGSIDDLVLVASGAAQSPFGFTSEQAESAQVELLKAGVGDQDRDTGWDMISNGDMAGIPLLLNSAKRKDPYGQFLMARHEATHHQDLVSSLLWLESAYQNGFFVASGITVEQSEALFKQRQALLLDSMSESELEMYNALKDGHYADFVGPEEMAAPSRDLLVVTQIADVLSDPEKANLFTTEIANERMLSPVIVDGDVQHHVVKLKNWLDTGEIYLPEKCTLGLSLMDSGAIADIGFAGNCGIDYKAQAELREQIWALPAPPVFLSGGAMPQYFELMF